MVSSHFSLTLRHYQVNGSWTDSNDIPYVLPLQTSNDSPPPEDDTKLKLTNLTEQATGLYSCRVTNQYGGAIATGSVTVTDQMDQEPALALTPGPVTVIVEELSEK